MPVLTKNNPMEEIRGQTEPNELWEKDAACAVLVEDFNVTVQDEMVSWIKFQERSRE